MNQNRLFRCAQLQKMFSSIVYHPDIFTYEVDVTSKVYKHRTTEFNGNKNI